MTLIIHILPWKENGYELCSTFRISAFLSLLSLSLCCWSRYDTINLTEKNEYTLLFRFFEKRPTGMKPIWFACGPLKFCALWVSCVKRTEAVIHDIWWAMIASVFLYMSGLEGIQRFVHTCGCIFVTAVATIVSKVQFVVLIVALQF